MNDFLFGYIQAVANNIFLHNIVLMPTSAFTLAPLVARSGGTPGWLLNINFV